MMDMEKLLSDDGARWRATQPAPPEPDLDRLVDDHPRAVWLRRPVRWQPVAAAAAVLAVVVAGVTVIKLNRSGSARPPAGGSTDALVRDGDTVTGQGEVLALPGQPVKFCGFRMIAVADVGRPAGTEPTVPPACTVALTATGIDLDRLSKRQQRDGAVWGYAAVTGVYRAGTLTVSEQEPYVDPPPPPPASAPDTVPCAAPPGGWTRQPDSQEAEWEQAVSRLTQAVNRNSTTYNGPYVRYPYGWHLQDTSNGKGIEVFVVGTTGDVAQAERELAAIFPAEHLCVTRAVWNKAAMEAAERELNSTSAQQAGVTAVRKEVLTDRVVAQVLVLTEETKSYLDAVGDGQLTVEPALRRVG